MSNTTVHKGELVQQYLCWRHHCSHVMRCPDCACAAVCCVSTECRSNCCSTVSEFASRFTQQTPVAGLATPGRGLRQENWPRAPADDCWMGIRAAALGRWAAGGSSSSAAADAWQGDTATSADGHYASRDACTCREPVNAHCHVQPTGGRSMVSFSRGSGCRFGFGLRSRWVRVTEAGRTASADRWSWARLISGCSAACAAARTEDATKRCSCSSLAVGRCAASCASLQSASNPSCALQ